jgi:hypothetical protein
MSHTNKIPLPRKKIEKRYSFHAINFSFAASTECADTAGAARMRGLHAAHRAQAQHVQVLPSRHTTGLVRHLFLS